jgi:hypothetical protein
MTRKALPRGIPTRRRAAERHVGVGRAGRVAIGRSEAATGRSRWTRIVREGRLLREVRRLTRALDMTRLLGMRVRWLLRLKRVLRLAPGLLNLGRRRALGRLGWNRAASTLHARGAWLAM